MNINWWKEQIKSLALGLTLFGVGAFIIVALSFGLTQTDWLWKVILGAVVVFASWAIGTIWRAK